MRFLPRSARRASRPSEGLPEERQPALKPRQELPEERLYHRSFHSCTLPLSMLPEFSVLTYPAIILNQTLYIDGGDIAERLPDGTALAYPNNATLALDLTRSWTNASDAVIVNNPKGAAPLLNLLSLWPAPDGRSFYAFGGLPSGTNGPTGIAVSPRSLFRFTPNAADPLSGSWAPVAPAPGNGFQSLVRPAGGLGAAGNGSGFLLGGFGANGARSGRALPGLLRYDMAANAWTNESAAGFAAPGTAILGAMHYLPSFGAEGVLVALGGQTADANAQWYDQGENLLDFGSIAVYDVAGKTWHRQPATAATPDALPAPRDMFCSALLTAPSEDIGGDGGAEIVVYGGQTGGFVYGPGGARGQALRDANAALNSVHVLSLPGFVWFKANDTSARSRTAHTCDVVGAGRRQVLSIGGLDPSVKDVRASANTSDPWPRGLGVWDAVAMRWTAGYDARAPPYERPRVVQEWYEAKYVPLSRILLP